MSIPSEVAGHWHTKAGQEMAAEYSILKREDLSHAEMPDFELANRIYLADRSDLDLIHWQTAAKERIRWLSVQLALARGEQ